MSKFNKLIEELLSEMAANVAGGEMSVTGPSTSGDGGGRVNVQDDKAYNYKDARLGIPLGMKNPYIKNLTGKRKPSKKPHKVPVQRRGGVYLPGM